MSPGLVRLCALAAMLGGGLWGAEAVLDAVAPPGRGDALFFVAPLLLLAGTAGLHARYAGRAGGPGSTGFVQAFIGLALLAGGFLADLTLGLKGAARASSFGFLILAFGLVLLGFDALKTKAFPRWNALPLVIGVLVPLSAISGGVAPLRVALSVLFGLGWALLGYLLLLPRGTVDEP